MSHNSLRSHSSNTIIPQNLSSGPNLKRKNTNISSPGVDRSNTTSNVFIISGVNSNAEAYFGGSSIRGIPNDRNNIQGPTIGFTTTPAQTFTLADGSEKTFPAQTHPIYGPSTKLYTRTNGETITWTGATSTTWSEISFPTPYVYYPTSGSTGGSRGSFNYRCFQTGGNENYGYVPQSVIDFMAKDPAITSQYPGIGKCLPGGPSIIHWLVKKL